MGVGLRQMPALDGLRGAAVAAVVAYHFWPGIVPGGFLGVDLFFVLSGYLITTLLLAEHDRTGGVRLPAFWARRARRLLPALFFLLAVLIAYAEWFAPAITLGELRTHGLAALFYVANWEFIREGTSYFTTITGPSPLQHTWSLAIEEQFYLVWPLVVLLCLRRRRGLRLLAGICAVGAVASAVEMAALYHPLIDPSRVYFGTDTHAQTILIGALLAVVVRASADRPARAPGPAVAQVAAGIGLLALVGAWAAVHDHDPAVYRGGFLAFGVAAAAVIWGARQSGPVTRLLEWAPLRGLGLVSYGVYLYHWPILILVTPARVHLHGAPLTLVRLGLLAIVALFSYYVIEQPIRTGRISRVWSVRLAPVGAAVCAALLVVTTVEPALPADLIVAHRGSPAAVPTSVVREIALGGGRPLKVLLLPDSIGWSLGGGGFQFGGMTDTYTSPFDPRKVELWNASIWQCDMQPGNPRYDKVEGAKSQTCANFQQHWAQEVDTFNPDVVLFQLGPFDTFDRRIAGKWVDFGTPADDQIIIDELDTARRILTSRGARLVILTSGYYDAPTWGYVVTLPSADWRYDHLNAVARKWVDGHSSQVSLIDIGKRLCPTTTCVARTPAGQQVRWDGAHYTLAGAQWQAAWLTPQLEALNPRRA